jgi:hypothetical protein
VIDPEKRTYYSSADEDAFRLPYNMKFHFRLSNQVEDVNEDETLVCRSLFHSITMPDVVDLHLQYDIHWDIDTMTVWSKAFPNVQHLSLRSYKGCRDSRLSSKLLRAIVLFKEGGSDSMHSNELSFPHLTTVTISASLFSDKTLWTGLPLALKERRRLHPRNALHTLVFYGCRKNMDVTFMENYKGIVPRVYCS